MFAKAAPYILALQMVGWVFFSVFCAVSPQLGCEGWYVLTIERWTWPDD